MTTASLTEFLSQALREAAPSALCIAFSGGPDSTALLHALAQLPEARERGLRALHVDHGLHPDSTAWATRCADFCAALQVPLATVRARVDDTLGEGIEAAARRARYAAFAAQLGDDERLALAHHRDDQIETVLLKLLRGAGPEGLGGMRTQRPFARGFLWRPLLDTPRQTLLDYLARHNLSCIHDPANDDRRFARNVLRSEIMPRIARHWPHADASILHAARLCRMASDYVAGAARVALDPLRRESNTLDATGWLALPDALRGPTLDTWLRELALPVPTDASREELARQAGQSGPDRVPLIAWPGAEVRVWNGRLHGTSRLVPVPEQWQAAWHGEALPLPEDCGTLTLQPVDPTSPLAAHFDPPVTVRFRQGSERIKPAGDAHTRELRDLFQQARTPPWLRARCPLVYFEDELIAVADLWISEQGQRVFACVDAKPRWVRPAHHRRDTE